ncbi:MAG: Pyruvate, phosphate dikinase [candidate division Zixibacteria bacterium RBG-1]|nr:MAG: Pyruvate, phosphate dikinase [candidate division Zixibacteria bacterium RBG-1]OGC83976.1 MAG: pyruvate, phosphate dikinase [candidate division Zixibacteria bacterium RBG_19FT_COMBO_42_43]
MGRAKKTVKKTSKKAQLFYFFGDSKTEGNGQMKDLLGGKGANLAEMSRIGIPVPPGFTISTLVFRQFYENGMKLNREVDQQMENYLKKVEKSMKAGFGDPQNPLLVSVRSGAKFSMPGMMDTILNIGLNDKTVQGLIDKSKNSRFAYDCYRRLLQMFGNVVMGIDKALFEHIIQKKKDAKKIKLDTSLSIDDLKDMIEKFKKLIKEKAGEEFPQNPLKQLQLARDAVFRSWNSPRAITYRRQYRISSDLGTAVNIQAMVFGNLGDHSLTGVGFTRNPSTGEKHLYGEYLTNAQGEDVVAGIRTPKPIDELKKAMPEVYKQLLKVTEKLEKHYRDLQDFEFTVQERKLYMLQTRSGKRTAQAAVKIAVDMVKEKLISTEEALKRISPEQINQLLHPRIDPKAQLNVIAKGLPASPGAARGKVVFKSEDATRLSEAGEKVILVRQETNPDDIAGMIASQGILTARGGMTSHAAVVARGMGKPCIVGCESIRVNEEKKQFFVGGVMVRERENITLNGSTGEVILGTAPLIEPELSGEFAEFMRWSDKVRKLGVRANADTPADAMKAIKFGAEGIGLCRTEHMFFAKERLPIVQEMILARTREEREAILEDLLPFQKSDFKAIFEIMRGLPVTIRTLDPPLHEFLPKKEELLLEIATLKANPEETEKLKAKELLLQRVEELAEFNPMLGHRGCRLGITFPEITKMQAKAIFDAACEIARGGKPVIPEVMIPLVGKVEELKNQKEIVIKQAEESMKKYKVKIKYHVGTMIEVPRAALTADEIATEAEFFSFGTNDLTQMTFGFSRDDSGKFLNYYIEHGILPEDPFVSIDEKGVGQLIEMAFKKGRAMRKDLKVGICGEHGGDPDSIVFSHKVGLDYVSCSPYRVPVARLAAAQAVVGKGTTVTE